MPSYKRIICLANSRKHSGRCIAGRELSPAGVGGWIRPVSSRAGEEVSEQERQYENGADPKLLDVVDIPVIEAKPHDCQSENWLIDPDQYWIRRGAFDRADLSACVETPATLWVNDHHTQNGMNDEVPEEKARELPRSLYLIHVPTVELQVCAPSLAWGNPKRRVQARFTFGNVPYWLSVTDPRIEREYLSQGDGPYPLGPSFLTVSLGEPFQKTYSGSVHRYKLVAAIL